MKYVLSVLSIIGLFFVTGCSVTVDKGAGVIHTSSFLGTMSHGYTEKSGLTIVNPSPGLRMVATYSVCTRLDRTAEAWRILNPKSDPYPIAEVFRDVIRGGAGEDIFIPAAQLTNHNDILRVTVDFYQSGRQVGSAHTERWVSFYRGTWQSEWRPRSQRL